MIAALIVVVAHALDALTFLLAVDRFGLWGETNPIAQIIAGAAGVGGLVALKLVGGMAAGGIILWLRRRADSWRRLPPQLPLVLAGGLGVIGAATNTWSLTL